MNGVQHGIEAQVRYRILIPLILLHAFCTSKVACFDLAAAAVVGDRSTEASTMLLHNNPRDHDHRSSEVNLASSLGRRGGISSRMDSMASSSSGKSGEGEEGVCPFHPSLSLLTHITYKPILPLPSCWLLIPIMIIHLNFLLFNTCTVISM
jgi:hypothetical protein